MPALTAAAMNGNHVIAEERPICHGCGLDKRIGEEHRPDCTVEPSPLLCAQPDCDAIRLPSEARDAYARGQLWQYRPSPYPGKFFCPIHHQKGTTA